MGKTDVVVVGAGPAGLLSAREIAGRGVEVKVVEEHQTIGEPNHCAGILSVEGLDRLGVKPSSDFVQHEITGGRIYSPGGEAIEISGERTRAYIVDRAAFDRHLAEVAEAEGAEVETGRRVKDLIANDGMVEGVHGRGWSVQAQLVVDAEGAGAPIARRVGLAPPTSGVLAGVNVEVSRVDVEPHMVEVWLAGDIAPGLFAWVAPLGDGAARCGLACSGGDALERLRGFLDMRFSRARCSPPRLGVVLTGGPARRTYSDGLLLVGDAAGQTKPTTGGGVILGGLCAIEAGRTAAEAVEAGDCSAGFLQRYQKTWRASLGGEFKSMLLARRLLNRMSDGQIDGLFDALRREGLEETLRGLVEGGDMDNQGGVIRSALRDPALLRVLIGVVGRLALGELRSFFKI
ncbi:MAG: NAD(P)/FAD-dependent oxidoreductase [Candidatus Bathyarchaeota archaeon]|nr:NAD(P)/FAD-dependent oxidoreductase [Candidatus Bathyarchaeota archaeon]